MRRHRLAAALWALVCGVAYAAIALRRFAAAEAVSWDNAIFEEAVRGYSQWGPPIVNIKGPGFNLLGDHFSPIIAVLGPVYRVLPHAQTLLVAQVVLIAVSIHVVTSVALRHLSWWAGAAVGAAYGLSFGIQSAVVSEFHEVAFAVPLLALAGAAFVEDRVGAVMAWSVPLLLVKEDLGITVAAAGVALYLIGERVRGLVLAVIGAAGSLLTVFVLIPAMRGGSGYAYAFGGHGALENLITDPKQKLLTLLLTVAVGGLVAVLSPWALVGVPTMLWRFAADNAFYWGTGFHYSLVLMPIMAMACVDVMRRRPWTVIPATMALVAVTVVMFGKSPVRQYAQPDAWHPTTREVAAQAVLLNVPLGVRVDTDVGLIAQLVTGRDVTFLGSAGNAVPDWVVIDHQVSPNLPSAAEYGSERYGVPFRPRLSTGTFDVASRVRHP